MPAIQRYNPDLYTTFLHRASFVDFNIAYNNVFNIDSCPSCVGRGGAITTEYQGDPPHGGLVDFFEACQDCVCQELCPGCMQPLALSFDQSAFGTDVPSPMVHFSYSTPPFPMHTFDYEDAVSAMPFDGFTCLVCGWQYDHTRLYERDAYDYDYDEGDYDYPTLDASDYFGGI